MNIETQQLPDSGIMQIDGKSATSVRYKRHVSQETGCTYDLTASFGGKPVVRLKGLTMVEVDEAIGHKNADAIHRRTDGVEQDTLRGAKLHYHNGTTEIGQIERAKLQEKALADSVSETKLAQQRMEFFQSAEAEAIARRMGITPAELQRRLQGHQAEQASLDGQVTGAIKRVDVPQQEPAIADERRREVEQEQAKIRAEVEKQFLVRDGRYYAKERDNRLIMEDRGHKLVTPEKDANTARNMANLAAAKGWDSIKVSGDPGFRREVWLEASARGITVQGFTPKEADIVALEARRFGRATNEVSRVASKPNLQAPERAEEHRENVRVGERAGSNTPTKSVRTERLDTVEVVAKAITAHQTRNPETQHLVAKEVASRLDRMQAQGKDPPEVRVYDKSAPAQTRGARVPNPLIERNTERTR